MKPLPEWARNVRFYGLFALAYFVFTSVAYAQYYIPSASMRPTLEVGDRLLVNKTAYGWSRYSLPILVAERVPLHGRLLAREPLRGDVVVFRRPDQPLILIKRVIGLPGDTFQMHRGVVYLNGEAVAQSEGTPVLLQEGEYLLPAIRREETLPDGGVHAIYDSGLSEADNFGPYIVPDGCFFVMGDHRDASADSRFWGCVPMSNLVGRAEIIAWTLSWRHPDPHRAREPQRLWRKL